MQYTKGTWNQFNVYVGSYTMVTPQALLCCVKIVESFKKNLLNSEIDGEILARCP